MVFVSVLVIASAVIRSWQAATNVSRTTATAKEVNGVPALNRITTSRALTGILRNHGFHISVALSK
jgi:hypothetical protein